MKKAAALLHHCTFVHTSYSCWRCYFCKTLIDARPWLEPYDVAFQYRGLCFNVQELFYCKVCACVPESVFLNSEARVILLLHCTNFCLPQKGRTGMDSGAGCSEVLLHCAVLCGAACS